MGSDMAAIVAGLAPRRNPTLESIAVRWQPAPMGKLVDGLPPQVYDAVTEARFWEYERTHARRWQRLVANLAAADSAAKTFPDNVLDAKAAEHADEGRASEGEATRLACAKELTCP
jgi:hypothetical protein